MKKIVIFEPKEVYHQGIVSILSNGKYFLKSLDGANKHHLNHCDLLILGFSEEKIKDCLSAFKNVSSPLLVLLDEDCYPFIREIMFGLKPLSYFHRASPASIFIRAVTATLKNERFIDRKIAPWLLEAYQPAVRCRDLSSRELSILNMVVNGRSNKEIARQLFISVSTVKFHLKNIYQKTNTNNRKELTTLFSDFPLMSSAPRKSNV